MQPLLSMLSLHEGQCQQTLLKHHSGSRTMVTWAIVSTLHICCCAQWCQRAQVGECPGMQVRDGRVTVTRAENGQGYMVTGLSKEDMEALRKGKERSQCILSLDMRDWEYFCTRVHPDSCLMTHRPPAYIPGAPRTPHTGPALLLIRHTLGTHSNLSKGWLSSSSIRHSKRADCLVQ